MWTPTGSPRSPTRPTWSGSARRSRSGAARRTPTWPTRSSPAPRRPGSPSSASSCTSGSPRPGWPAASTTWWLRKLAELVERHPLREGLRGLHIRALYAAGRQAEALESYAGLRERLADELGLDPGPELAALYRQILDQDPGLSAPPKSAIVRNSLPAQLDELIGRAEALTELRTLIPAGRLLTLVGPGGVGKTRLAAAAAAEQVQPDGVHLVELAPLPAADTRVAEQALGVLGLHEAPGTTGSAADRLVAALRHREMLLVLDNCEHVIGAVAALVGRLLRDAPGVRVLATSREPLLLAGERIWEVGPLALPSDPTDVDAVRRSAAARLFVARAAAQHRGFRLDEQTAPAVAQLCRRLDGLPWRWNWPRPGCALSAYRAWWIALTTASGCSPRGSGMCRNGSAP